MLMMVPRFSLFVSRGLSSPYSCFRLTMAVAINRIIVGKQT